MRPLDVLVFVLALLFLAACGVSRPVAYGAELAACTERSATLCESVACEQDARARYGRPPRQMPASCVDGGAP